MPARGGPAGAEESSGALVRRAACDLLKALQRVGGSADQADCRRATLCGLISSSTRVDIEFAEFHAALSRLSDHRQGISGLLFIQESGSVIGDAA